MHPVCVIGAGHANGMHPVCVYACSARKRDASRLRLRQRTQTGCIPFAPSDDCVQASWQGPFSFRNDTCAWTPNKISMQSLLCSIWCALYLCTSEEMHDISCVRASLRQSTIRCSTKAPTHKQTTQMLYKGAYTRAWLKHVPSHECMSHAL